jgi:hypothetical protein
MRKQRGFDLAIAADAVIEILIIVEDKENLAK